jgi:competence protein ComEC
MNEHPVVRVAFLDVGQGDTNVISLPETSEAVIVDCADAHAVMRYLEYAGIQQLRGLLVTHLHLDHYSGVVQLLNNLESELNLACERVFFHRPVLSNPLRDSILNDEDHHSDGDLTAIDRSRQRKNSIANLLGWAKRHKERYNNLTIQPGVSLPLPGIIELLHPWEIDIPELLSHGLNNTSGIIKVNGSNSSALLTGDIEPSGWAQVGDKSKLQSDVLKFPHHGAWNDDVMPLLDAVKPSIIVISVGTSGIRYGHPNPDVFAAIGQQLDIRLLCTQVTGQCASNIEGKQSQIAETFKQLAADNSAFFHIEQRGCPCAGAVIVELGESVRVFQPTAEFHRAGIIQRYNDTHQCIW